MNLRLPHLALAALLLAVSGGWADEGTLPVKVEMGVIPGALRYATTRFDVHLGDKVDLTLKNTCIMPHNFVLGWKGKADELVKQAVALGAEAVEKNFVPGSNDVIAATKIVNPGQAETIRFTAPNEAGDFPYLCTFPGHGTVMRGIMRVRPAGDQLEDPVTEKFDATKSADGLQTSGITPFPIGTREHPLILRTFVPNPGLGEEVLSHHERGFPAKRYYPNNGEDSTTEEIPAVPGVPAGIAVSFGPEFAFAWDATECRLLYAWTGGFLDMTPYWGKGTGGGRWLNYYVPPIQGMLVFKTAGPLPFQLGDGSKPRFRGYHVINGNPEFFYEVGGTKIHELIMPSDPGTFMIHYRVEQPPEPLRLAFDAAIRPRISCDQGGWKGNTLEIPADHADRFMLLVKFKEEKAPSIEPDKTKKPTTSEEP